MVSSAHLKHWTCHYFEDNLADRIVFLNIFMSLINLLTPDMGVDKLT